MSDTTLNPSAWHHLARRRDLWWQFTVRAVEMKHRGSYLGIIWTVINPLLMMGLYLFVFGTIFGGSFHALPDETKLDYAFGLFLGLTFFNVLAETIGISPILIVTNPNLVKKVVFPLEVLPLAQLGASWFNFLISLSLLLIGALTFGRGLAPHGLLWLPVIILPHLLLTIGLGWLLSALGVFFRDVQHIVQFAAQVILYASAIFYSPSDHAPAILVLDHSAVESVPAHGRPGPQRAPLGPARQPRGISLYTYRPARPSSPSASGSSGKCSRRSLM